MKLKILCLLFALSIGLHVSAIEKKDSLFLNLLKPDNISLYDNFNHGKYVYEGLNLLMQDSLEEGMFKLVKGLNLINRNNNMERTHDYQSQEFFQLMKLAVDDNVISAQKELLLDFFGKSLKQDINGVDKLITKEWVKSLHPETNLRLLVFVSSIRNNPKETDKYLKELLKNFPDIFTANLLKAEMLYNAGDWLKSKYYFTRAIKLNSTSSFAYVKRGLCNKELDLCDEAKKDLRFAIKLSPSYIKAWNEIGRIYDDSKQYKKAVASYRKTIEINPFYVWGHANLGLTYSKSGIKDSALYYYNNALELYPNSDNYYNRKGDVYYKFKNYNEAIYNYSKAIELNPNKDYYWDDRGDAYFKIDSFEYAKKDFVKAYELDSNYEYAIKRAGDCCYGQEDWSKAIEYYTKAIKIDPEYELAIRSRAYCYLELNELKKSIDDFNLIVTLYPKNIYNRLARAEYFIEIKDYKAAKIDLLAAKKIDPKNSSAIGNLGWTYYCLNQFEDCIELSAIAISMDENAYYAKFNQALATLRLGKTNEAYELYLRYYDEASKKKVDIDGAIQDLNDLIDKNILVSESRYILQEILKAKL
ncbi:tetratricopeptide repeat protein [Marinifilum sp. N1E240]|uniref:tetratricopeptide repeat protein n=1 Tax=Marinifilum sp. N1E240 TaxID=2608082 RepID=UPI00128CE305|nr:tetratricopeptide repeat protein [Marinifilum sp. N1E240]MPQ45567.1 tetratricopeptide repeat protein [Marinifilum sp. N1E240]